jgi:uncharacterized protein with PhoU and TrkA domain
LPAAVAGGLGIAYLWLLAPRIIPKRDLTLADTSPRIFAAHLDLLENSPAAGKTLAEAIAMTDGAMRVTSVRRGPESNFMLPLPDMVLRADDRLVIQDTPERLKAFEKVLEGTLYPEDSEDKPVDDDHPLKAEDQQIAEVVVIEGSRLQGRTLSRMRFADRYGLFILALHRTGKPLAKLHDEIGDVRLKAGDVLLVQGPREQIATLKMKEDFLRTGVPLILIMWITLSWLLPTRYGLR